MEIFRNAFLASESHNVATKLLSAPLCAYLGYIGSGFGGIPFGRIDPLRLWLGTQRHSFARPVRAHDPRLYSRVARRQIRLVANLCAQLNAAIVFEIYIRRCRHHSRRRSAHDPTQKLPPESFLAYVAHGLLHPPAPASTRRENGCPPSSIIFGNE